MARFLIDGPDLVLRLSWSERVGGVHGDVRVPLSAVRSVTAVPKPWLALRGWRMAGVSIPGSLALGTRRHGSGYDFTAVYKQRPAVQVELNTGRFERIVASVAGDVEVESEADRIAGAAGIGR